MAPTIAWTGSTVRLLDQTRLPLETQFVEIADAKGMWGAIRRLVVRGAPAIGVAAAFGAYLGVRDFREEPPGEWDAFGRRLGEVCQYLKSSRPTAVNLAWALDRIARLPALCGSGQTHSIHAAKAAILQECLAMLEEDGRVCRAIGEHGMALLQQHVVKDRTLGILTHCNAGALATAGCGTALAPVYVGIERGVSFHVYADETRPLLQGSRLTAYELSHSRIPVTVICDNMAADVMSRGRVSAVLVGADRIAANGDVANKIGTLGVAILARHFGLPFYVAAPTSTVDPALATGALIPIEQRDSREVSFGLGRQTVADDVDVYNPAFDVTPADLISAVITEKGVLRPPYAKTIAAIMTAGA